MNSEDRELMRDVLRNWYGDQVNSWDMNNRVYDILVEMIESNATCSKWMSRVPSPFPGGNAIRYAAKQVRKFLRRLLDPESRPYIVCLKSIAWTRKSDVVMAARRL